MTGDAGEEQADEVIEIENVVALPGVLEDREQSAFPLAHIRHAGDEPLRRHEPCIESLPVAGLPLFDAAEGAFVNNGRLAAQPRPSEQHRAAVGEFEQP